MINRIVLGHNWLASLFPMKLLSWDSMDYLSGHYEYDAVILDVTDIVK